MPERVLRSPPRADIKSVEKPRTIMVACCAPRQFLTIKDKLAWLDATLKKTSCDLFLLPQEWIGGHYVRKLSLSTGHGPPMPLHVPQVWVEDTFGKIAVKHKTALGVGACVTDLEDPEYGTEDYCIVPAARVLRADLRWARADEIRLGDELVGFDEKLSQDCRYRRSVVVAVKRLRRPVYRVVTDRGEIVASDNHLLVVRSKRRGLAKKWKRVDEVEPGNGVAFLAAPWEYDSGREGGELAGFFAGEGHHRREHLSFGQKRGPLAEHVLQLLQTRNYQIKQGQYERQNKVANWYIGGGRGERMRFLGSIRPPRLIDTAHLAWEGCALPSKSNRLAVVEQVEPLGVQEVIAVQTSTGTLIAEGFLSHNCYFSADGTLAGQHRKFALPRYDDYRASGAGRLRPETVWRERATPVKLPSLGLTIGTVLCWEIFALTLVPAYALGRVNLLVHPIKFAPRGWLKTQVIEGEQHIVGFGHAPKSQEWLERLRALGRHEALCPIAISCNTWNLGDKFKALTGHVDEVLGTTEIVEVGSAPDAEVIHTFPMRPEYYGAGTENMFSPGAFKQATGSIDGYGELGPLTMHLKARRLEAYLIQDITRLDCLLKDIQMRTKPSTLRRAAAHGLTGGAEQRGFFPDDDKET